MIASLYPNPVRTCQICLIIFQYLYCTFLVKLVRKIRYVSPSALLLITKKLELVFILAAPPCVDSHLKRRLSEHRSSFLASLVPLSMRAPQIRHCPLLGLDERDLFARGGDGVHMHGVHARQIYTSAIWPLSEKCLLCHSLTFENNGDPCSLFQPTNLDVFWFCSIGWADAVRLLLYFPLKPYR